MNDYKSLSISSVAFLTLSLILLGAYKAKGGRKSGLIYMGEFGKLSFFIGVIILAIRQLIQDIDQNENN